MSAVLGIDTATGFVSVTVMRGQELVWETSQAPGEDGRPRHTELLLEAVEDGVRTAGGWEQIRRIAIGLGPGSYTGLRIGIATARGLAQARRIPIAGVGTLAALARGMLEHERAAGRPALAVIDARRTEAFAALYAPDGEQVWTPFVASPDELADRVRGLADSPLAAGDGSLRFRQQLEGAGAIIAAPDDPVHRISARHICALGAGDEVSPPHPIRPMYLRAPDAEKWLERDQRQFSG
ncbi:MAG: tRNA (adenosine(37)-N6)-threonylcarbamoyltransferase complex dimerization subunit type 1 TsaB [Actinomycetota bacterium]|nr:tRNA (adenosine(37)-N6)-threonylcarbamoyltransferase complex dimerization subunit type 1 TsaB [Actinomycetota bacterium]